MCILKFQASPPTEYKSSVTTFTTINEKHEEQKTNQNKILIKNKTQKKK